MLAFRVALSERFEDVAERTTFWGTMPEPLRWLFKIFDVLVVAGMAVISLLIFTNVVLRYGFSSGIPFAVEVSRVVLVWVIFMGSVAALAKARISASTRWSSACLGGRVSSAFLPHTG